MIYTLVGVQNRPISGEYETMINGCPLFRNYWTIVKKLAKIQVIKLVENHHKGGWDEITPEWAFKRTMEECAELYESIVMRKHPDEVKRECADVANFLLMTMESYERNYQSNPIGVDYDKFKN